MIDDPEQFDSPLARLHAALPLEDSDARAGGHHARAGAPHRRPDANSNDDQPDEIGELLNDFTGGRSRARTCDPLIKSYGITLSSAVLPCLVASKNIHYPLALPLD